MGEIFKCSTPPHEPLDIAAGAYDALILTDHTYIMRIIKIRVAENISAFNGRATYHHHLIGTVRYDE